MSVNHYENFPVASFLLPAHLRPAVRIIYAFARSADDIADEGQVDAHVRFEGLRQYDFFLNKIEDGILLDVPFLFRDLAEVVKRYDLPLSLFRDLLSAFRQDVVLTRYQTFEQLQDYCARSANPVGRLMLYLYGAFTQENSAYSDAICSALQLVNFWQDVALDWQKGRIYLPQEDLCRFDVLESDIASHKVGGSWRSLMQFEVSRARSLLLQGAPLAIKLPGRIGWELRLVVQGALRILERIEAVEYDVFFRRPVLTKRDTLIVFWRAIRM